jgi:hypothetical protein
MIMVNALAGVTTETQTEVTVAAMMEGGRNIQTMVTAAVGQIGAMTAGGRNIQTMATVAVMIATAAAMIEIEMMAIVAVGRIGAMNEGGRNTQTMVIALVGETTTMVMAVGAATIAGRGGSLIGTIIQ